MNKKADARSDSIERRAKEYRAYQRKRDLEERSFKRGFDLAFQASKKGKR